MPFRYAVAKVSLDHHSASCWKTMARHASSWDLRHLSGKYPWLRVDNETIEEFRAPFEWVEAASESASSEEELETDEERGKDSVPKRQHSHSRRYSLAYPTNRRAASVIKGKPSRKRQLSPKKLPEKSGNRVQTPPIAPQKHSATSHTTDAMIPPPKSVLEASVYPDWAAVRQQQQHKTRRNPKKPIHSILSLSLPSLHKSPQVASRTSLANQLTRIAQQERSLQQQVYSQIEVEKAKLPLTFLFERQLDQSYCRQKSVETITTIFGKLHFRLVYSAFQRWKSLNDALNKQELQEAALERAKIRALDLLDRHASDCYVGTLDRAFERWRNMIKAMAEHERQSAARKIQSVFRQRRAKALLHELKRASMDRAYKLDVEIQQFLRFERYARAVRGRAIRLGVSLLLQNHAAKRIQGLFRWIRTQKRILRRYRRKIAAVRIQTRWRIRLATRELNKRRRAAEIRRERERVASINLQRRTRGYLARQHAALRQAHLAMENQHASKLQQFWRRYQARDALKKRFLVRKALLEAEQARLRELEHLEAIRQDALRKERMAVHIQRVVRGFLGRCEAKHRQHMQKRDLAARRVQTQWRRRQGNYALHLRFLVQRERLDERRNAAALRIQCAFRFHKAYQYRRELIAERQRRRHSATVIQRVVRGRHARKEYIRARRATVTIQSAMRGRLARDERHQRHKERLEEQAAKDGAALRLQCWLRTLHARRMAQQRRDERQRMEELVQQSALLIQKRARGMEARRVTNLLARAMRLVEKQQRRRYAYSTQRNVNTSPLLAFLSSDYHQAQPDVLEQMIQDADAELISEDRAVVLLQRHFRGYAARLGFVVLQTQQWERKKLEDRMCRLLQRVARGYLARKRVRQLKQKQRSEALKAAYIRERHSKSQQEAWEERYKQEQMTLQLQRLQMLETMRVDAKRDAEVAKWQAEAALYRKQELQAQLEAQKLQDKLKHDAWELVTDAKGQPYYYNTISGESSWEKPSSPPKPPQKEEKPDEKPTEESVLSAKPNESKETATDPVVPEGFCSKCRNTEAVKACLGCQPPTNYFCSECFTLHHGLLDPRGGTTHDFQVLRPFQLPSRCQASKDHGLCHALASYYCQSCVSHDFAHKSGFYCEDCFTAAHDSALLSSHLSLAVHFRLGATLCAECQQVLALRQCVGCDEALCVQCFEKIHEASQKKQSHEFTQLELMKEVLTSARDAYCIDCTLRKCTKLCNLCGDGFCSGCFDKQHSIGQRALHTWIPWTQFTQYDDWLVIHDDQVGKKVYFNIETKESTHTKPFVLQSGEDRHRVLFHEREQQLKARALVLEGEVTQLQDKLRIVEEEKAVLIQRPRSRVADASNAEAKPDQGRPRKGKLKSLFSRSKGEKVTMAEGESTITQEELAKQALKKGVTSSEQSLLQQKLMTRSREEKEAKAQRTIGTKHFEDAMIQQLSTDPPSKVK